MTSAIGAWGHCAAAFLFGLLAVWHLRRPSAGAQHHLLTAAFAATALWALAVGFEEQGDALGRLGETIRNLAWLAFAGLLLRAGRTTTGDEGRRHVAVVALYCVLGLVLGAQTALDILPPFFRGDAGVLAAFGFASLVMRMVVAIGALVLVHNLYTAAAPDARWGIRLPVIGLAAMWTYDLNVYTLTYLTHGWSQDLLALRGLAMAMLAPLFGLAARRNARWKMRLSRAVAFQSLSLMAIGGYLVTMVLVVRVIEMIGGDFRQLLQVVTVFGMTVTALVLLPSGKVHGWAKVKVAKHFFQHRYDYRSEWLRFTDTLALAGEGAGPLDARVVKAIADIADSPGGLLLSRGEAGDLTFAARWNWCTAEVPAVAGSPLFASIIERSGWIVELDGAARTLPSADTPAWMVADPRAWAAVPLIHLDRLIGVVVLERPRFDRSLDWEDFDLLRIAGRQAASYLAEAEGQKALNEAQRFDEFNRRFAFILHDIKNLVSQLTLLARNAERHADNPAFRDDMILTLRSSAGRMSALLARLSPQERGRAEEPRAIPLRSVVEAAIVAPAASHPISLSVGEMQVLAEPARLEQALAHLVQNAVDASTAGDPVTLSTSVAGNEVRLAISDHGHGMSAEFLRTELFRPFASTKPGGFGIGAHEARAIISAVGGRLEVESREGGGTTFTVVLPFAASASAAPERMRQTA